MGQMGRMEDQDRPANGYMREAMPQVSAWIDELRAVFGRSDVTEWVRQGLAEGTFHAAENGHEIGQAVEVGNAISLVDVVIESPLAKRLNGDR